MQGFSQLTDQAAATVSAIMTVLRGPGAPGSTPAECKKCTPALLAEWNEVCMALTHVIQNNQVAAMCVFVDFTCSTEEESSSNRRGSHCGVMPACLP